MCVAAIAWRADPRWPLVAIANRDEFHERPTAALEDWGNGVLAGRDLEAGGTWLGVSSTGRFALVTNYRVEGFPKSGLASRGGLVTGWLEAGTVPDGADMNPFHLVACDGEAAWHLTNQPLPVRAALAPGLHGVSNGAFDTPWAKTARLVSTLGDWLGEATASTEALFAALADETELPAEADSEGPMAQFSPVFIRSPVYGTRCSTVMTVDAAGQGRIEERRFDASGAAAGTTALDFDWAML
jgi:uncharacterized protein with NRDE domain